MAELAMALVAGQLSTPADVIDAITQAADQASEITEAQDQALAELLARSPTIKVCLVERFGPAEMMLWVGPGVWHSLQALRERGR